MAEHETAVAPEAEQAASAGSPAGASGLLLGAPLSPQSILGLQRAAGNRAVGRMLQRQSSASRALPLERQAGNRALARVPDDAEAQRIADLRQKLDDAIKYEHWREAAQYLNAFSPDDIQTTLGRLSTAQKGALYQGAIFPDGPGEDSNVARATRTFYLDGEISKAIAGSQWGWAAKYLNAFNEPDLRQRLNGLKTPDIQAIHDAAETTPGVGGDSAVSKVSAVILEQRKSAPTPASERLAQQLYDALKDGIDRGDPKTLEAAKHLAMMFYEARLGAHGEVSVSVDKTKVRNTAKRAGISPEGLDKCIALVAPFAPKDKRIGMDYAGRVGTQENLAAREQADKLQAITEADTTLGSLMMSYVAARGGNAAEMRAANELGSNLEAFASTMPVAGAHSPDHSSVEEQSRTGAEVRKNAPTPAAAEASLAVGPEAEARTGMPIKNQKAIADTCRAHNVLIEVRGTNPEAPRRLADGNYPKPEAIKAKSINQLDTYIGFRRDDVGLVGYMKPTPPVQSEVPPEMWESVQKRYADRTAEFKDLAPDMQNLSRPVGARDQFAAVGFDKQVAVDGHGVIRVVEGGKTGTGFTGDHDLFQIRNADGTPVSGQKYNEVVSDLAQKGVGVEHGAHMHWDVPPTPNSPAFKDSGKGFQSIADKHMPGAKAGEDLYRFGPDGSIRPVRADPAKDTLDAARAAGKADKGAAVPDIDKTVQGIGPH